MREFVSSHVKSVERKPGSMPRPADCLRVDQVALGSVAAAAGVFPGDWLVELDGAKASTIDPALSHHWVSEHRYRFFSKSSSDETLVETTGIPPGLGLSPTAQSVAATFDPANADADALYSLWKQGEWATLHRLAAADLEGRSRAGFLGKLMGKGNRNTPSVVLLGAALYERGRKDQARALFEEYMTTYSKYWTQNFMGIADYYAARDYADAGDRETALEAAVAAHLGCESERTAELVESLSGQRPPLNPKFLLESKFPASYDLPLVDGPTGSVSLASCLKKMGQGKLLIVCLLADYRGNRPYNDFMKRFRNYATHFADYLFELHVVTMTAERRTDRPHWFEAEVVCQKEGLPFRILLDDGEVTETVHPTGSPAVFVLDASGTVIQEGLLVEVDFWQALARVAA